MLMIVRFLQIEGGDVEAYLSILDTLTAIRKVIYWVAFHNCNC